MAIITTAEVKTILQISGSDYDTYIAQMIPIMQEYITDYCNDVFLNKNLYIDGPTFSFTSRTVSDSDSGFVTAGFVSGMDIYIEGSDSNDGLYSLNTAAAASMTTTSTAPVSKLFVTEDAGAYLTIYHVQYPQALKMACANMIGYQMSKQNLENVSSEKIGDYSVSYADVTGEYPNNILQTLKHYKRPSFV
jgi:hypothetical protein